MSFVKHNHYQLESLGGGHGCDGPDDEVLCQHSGNFRDRRHLAVRELPLEDGEVLEGEGRQQGVDGLLQVLVPNLGENYQRWLK